LWQVAFALTLACELPVYVLALRRPLDGTWRALAVGVAVNVATHPLAWALAVRGALPYLAIEGGVWLVEAALISAAARAWRSRRCRRSPRIGRARAPRPPPPPRAPRGATSLIERASCALLAATRHDHAGQAGGRHQAHAERARLLVAAMGLAPRVRGWAHVVR